MVLTAHPPAFGFGGFFDGHTGKAVIKVEVDGAFIARPGEKVHVKETFVARIQRGGVRRINGIIDLVCAFVELQITEPAIAAVIGKLQVGQDGDDGITVFVFKDLHTGAMAMAAYQHKNLVVVFYDIPQFLALLAQLGGAGLGVGAVLKIMGGDDGRAVGIFLQYLSLIHI